MTFPSYTFALFFLAVWLVYRSPLPFAVRKAVLLVASYFFYAVWNPPFVALLWVSTAVDWVAARRIHASEDAFARKAWLALSLATNLGLLGFFKYGSFAATAFVDGAAMLGVPVELAAPSVVLPVGISFYTFQTLSYSIDVYRGRLAPARSPLDYALYVTFFPQLVAGPIVRAGTFLPQCEQERRPDADTTAWALSLVVLGLFQKVVLADALLAPIVDATYAGGPLSTGDAWLGTLAFAGQIFCDFSGYSTIAIGVALTLGFHLPDNFRAPYAAIGFSDFWRRWHISLSTWLRDYLYIPLGGNRHGLSRTMAALSVTMFLGGLWHGASWTFVVWGLLHGAFLVVEHAARRALGTPAWTQGTAGRAALTALTFAAVCVGWVFFRADSFAQAFAVLSAMFGASERAASLLQTHQVAIVLVTLGGLLAAHVWLRDARLEERLVRVPAGIRTLALTLALLALLTSPGPQNAFIYFQF